MSVANAHCKTIKKQSYRKISCSVHYSACIHSLLDVTSDIELWQLQFT